MRRFLPAAPAILSVAVATSAVAAPALSLSATTDLRERGLSESAERAAIDLTGDLPVTGGLGLSLGAASLRGSARHGGAELELDIGARYRLQAGPWLLSAAAKRRLFVDEGRLDYWELEGGATQGIGPARVGLWASYAPAQDAIGGDNLYLEATAEVGIPGTPVTLYGGVGRSSGHVDDPVRAGRLRPDGRYWDQRIGIEYVAGRMSVGARLSGTSIGRVAQPSPFVDRHRGTRAAGYARIDF